MRGVGRADEVRGLGRDVVDGLVVGTEVVLGAGAASCFAREAAVGAVSREGRSMGFVVSLGLAREAVDCCEVFDVDRSAPAVLATEAAVGAVNELRLGFLVGPFAAAAFGDSVLEDVEALLESGVFG